MEDRRSFWTLPMMKGWLIDQNIWCLYIDLWRGHELYPGQRNMKGRDACPLPAEGLRVIAWCHWVLSFPFAVKQKVLVAQSCPTLCNSLDHSPPGSSVHGILQARTLECSSIPSAGDLSNPGTELWSPTLQVDSLPLVPPGDSDVSDRDVLWGWGVEWERHDTDPQPIPSGHVAWARHKSWWL